MNTSRLVRFAAVSLFAFATACNCGGGEEETCTYTLSEATGAAVGEGGSGSFDVAAGATCGWTATSSADWLTVTSLPAGIGPGTVTWSAAPSDTSLERSATLTVGTALFTVTQSGAACTFTLQPTDASYAAAAGSGSVDVVTPIACAWTATSDAPSWLTVTSGTPGSGPGTVAYSVAANADAASRTGTLTVGGQPFTVSQGGAGCTYGLSAAAGTATSDGGTGSVTVTAQPGCGWVASSSAPWLTVTSGGAGSGGGTIQYSVAANATTSQRSATLTVAGQVFTLTQDPASCSAVTLTPPAESYAAAGGTGSIGVSIPAGCAWTATSNAATWLTVTGGASGTGSGTVFFRVAANATASSRTGTIVVAGQTFTVTQGAASCTYALASATGTATAAGGPGSVAVTAGAGCFWSATSSAPWLTVTAGIGSGNGAVAFSVAANPSSTWRSATLDVAGQLFTLTQDGASCSTVTLTPTGHSLAAAAGSGSVAVSIPSGCAWTAASDAPTWLTVTSGASGTGPGTVYYSVAANAATTSRTGALTIAGQLFTVAQGGAECTYAVAPGADTADAAGDAGSATVTSQAGCTWFAVSSAPWLTVTAGAVGSGSGTVTWSAAANPTATQRVATIDIAGGVLSVTQAGASCTAVSLSPTSASYDSAAATGSVAVTIPAGCPWTAASGAAWLSVVSGAEGTGGGTVVYSLAANTSPTVSRTGTLTIAGLSFNVSQGAAGCTWSLPATSTDVGAGAGSGTAGVTAGAGCTWTASSNAPWITVTPPASGTGSGSVGFSYQANPSSAPRSGTLTLAGLTFTVNQAGMACSYATTPTAAQLDATQFSAAAGAGVLSVSTAPGCLWTATASSAGDWITITGGAAGSGNGAVFFSLAENAAEGGAVRDGTITVGGITLTIHQKWGADVIIIVR